MLFFLNAINKKKHIVVYTVEKKDRKREIVLFLSCTKKLEKMLLIIVPLNEKRNKKSLSCTFRDKIFNNTDKVFICVNIVVTTTKF